jgi:hypothetical protein
MYNSEQNPFPSSSHEGNTLNDLSSSGPGFEARLVSARLLAQIHLFTDAQTISQGVFQIPVPLLPGSLGPVYGGGPSYEHAPNNTVVTLSSVQGDGNAPHPADTGECASHTV